MLQQILTEIYERDLGKLKAEIESFPDDQSLWERPGNVPNSAGNLCLHLCGNLQHFFGAVLDHSGYVRDRESEFSRSDVPRRELLDEIDAARRSVTAALSKLTDEDLAADYPIEVFGTPMSTGWFATHLATHLSWHLGQIYYLRRLK
ncbi:MAG: DinB family protein [Chloracidobacterium sp.]|nr:DinB family protein [Chloracidobacterium sp.]